MKDGHEGAPQAAFDRLRGAQTAGYTSSKIEIDQRPDGDLRGGRASGLVLFGNQITAATRGAGQLIGPFARLFETYIGGAPSDSRRVFPAPRMRYARSQVFTPLDATRTASPLQR
jgi:hypothetical protein